MTAKRKCTHASIVLAVTGRSYSGTERSGRVDSFDRRATGGTVDIETCEGCGLCRYTLRNCGSIDVGEWVERS